MVTDVEFCICMLLIIQHLKQTALAQSVVCFGRDFAQVEYLSTIFRNLYFQYYHFYSMQSLYFLLHDIYQTSVVLSLGL